MVWFCLCCILFTEMLVDSVFFSILTLLVGWQEGIQPVPVVLKKNKCMKKTEDNLTQVHLENHTETTYLSKFDIFWPEVVSLLLQWSCLPSIVIHVRVRYFDWCETLVHIHTLKLWPVFIQFIYCCTYFIFISTKWTKWNWRIYCFHFCLSVCLCTLSPGWNDVSFAEKCIRLVWKVDSISVQTRYCWKRCFIGFLTIWSGSRSKWGFRRNVQKCNIYITKWIYHNTPCSVDVMATIGQYTVYL